MATNISKYQAEQALGLKDAYVLSDVKKAYRKKVKECHPDAGGNPDDMVRVNQANDLLMGFFDKDPNAVITCSAKDETVRQSVPYSRYPDATDYRPAGTSTAGADWAEEVFRQYAENMQQHQYEQSQGGYREWIWDFGQGSNVTSRGWTVNVGGVPQSSEVENGASGKQYNSVGDVFKEAIGSYYDEKYGTEIRGDEPAWWRKWDFRVRRGKWRLWFALIMILVGFALSAIVSAVIPAGFVLGGVIWIVAIGAAVWNGVTGGFTNPMRKRLRIMIDKRLEQWRRKQKS